ALILAWTPAPTHAQDTNELGYWLQRGREEWRRAHYRWVTQPREAGRVPRQWVQKPTPAEPPHYRDPANSAPRPFSPPAPSTHPPSGPPEFYATPRCPGAGGFPRSSPFAAGQYGGVPLDGSDQQP